VVELKLKLSIALHCSLPDHGQPQTVHEWASYSTITLLSFFGNICPIILIIRITVH